MVWLDGREKGAAATSPWLWQREIGPEIENRPLGSPATKLNMPPLN
jgi:hypothetical protein